MIGLLAIVGAIVIAVWLLNRMKNIGHRLARFEEAVLDRLSSGFPGLAPHRRDEELKRLDHTVRVVRDEDGFEFPDEEEIRNEIEKLTS